MKFFPLLMSVVFISGVSLASTDSAIELRQKLFKEFKKEMGAIKDIVSEGKLENQADMRKHAKALDAAVREQWDHQTEHFPVGSDQGETDALPEIWSDAENFSVAIRQERDALADLLVAVEKPDPQAWKASFKQVGAACKNCHEQFKKD